MPSCSRPSRTLRAADAVARRRAILDRHCARRHEARAGRGGRMVPIEPKDGTRAGVDWWVSVKDLTPTPPSEPLKPSTGAAVRDHRNAVRDASESLSAINRKPCPQSPESAGSPCEKMTLSVRYLNTVRPPFEVARNTLGSNGTFFTFFAMIDPHSSARPSD